MLILFFTLFLFLLAIFAQLITWKINIPKGQMKAIFLIFSVILVTGIFSLWVITNIMVKHVGCLVYLHILSFYIVLMLVYMGNYPAIEVSSPSILIVMNIAHAGLTGLSSESLNQLMNDDILVKPRIEDLFKAKMIREQAGRYTITKKGIAFVKMFVLYRKIINTPKGG